ncbi:hypothetical protein, partial [Neobacillus mesonae]|uniref:hypothetical protein n=1 Tax=Neobacillus mesonae TaxID=1193713 RepID=UPI00203A5412
YPCDGIVSHNIKILLENRVEKYFFDTPPTGQTVDKSTFIEGGCILMDTHLLTVNVEKAKGRIEKLQNKIEEFQSFIDSAKNYDPCTFEQTVIKEYANLGSIAKVLNLVNERNYTKIQDKKYTSSDITTILESKPMDELHKYVQKIYRTNKKNGHQKKRGYY